SEFVTKYRAQNHVDHMTLWHYFLMVLASPYTLFSALIASTIGNMAAFGTDQDMVQRLLTAQTYKKARRSLITAAVMDLPIATVFAYAKVRNPDVRIIPVVLGIGGFILGPMLGVFLLGMFTRRRGSDVGNMIAITIGLATTIILGGLHVEFAKLIARQSHYRSPT